MIAFTPPMECLSSASIPASSGWVYELKLDGFRAQTVCDKNGVRLYSKNGKDFTRKFPRIVAALKSALKVGTVLDGELVAFNSKGQPSFAAMQDANAKTHVVFYVFDILQNAGRDTKHLPLSERLELLQSAFAPSDLVQHTVHFIGPADRFAAMVRKVGGEGVIAKRLSSPYEPGKRSGAWRKTRFNLGQEFVIGGFTPGSNGIDALVVGFFVGKMLFYAARVRAGLIPAMRQKLHEQLKPLVVENCPFVNLPEAKSGRWGQGLTAAKMRDCIWVQPKFVANFEFLEWTDSNHVRHIKFVGIRTDKAPRTVTREL